MRIFAPLIDPHCIVTHHCFDSPFSLTALPSYASLSLPIRRRSHLSSRCVLVEFVVMMFRRNAVATNYRCDLILILIVNLHLPSKYSASFRRTIYILVYEQEMPRSHASTRSISLPKSSTIALEKEIVPFSVRLSLRFGSKRIVCMMMIYFPFFHLTLIPHSFSLLVIGGATIQIGRAQECCEGYICEPGNVKVTCTKKENVAMEDLRVCAAEVRDIF